MIPLLKEKNSTEMKMSKIAIVGSGIGAMASAYDLKKLGHQVFLFEKNDYFGGHTHTHNFRYNNYDYTVDTGFLVHNDRTYPNLIKFFDELELETYPSEMTFSVHSVSDDLEWCGDNLKTVFAQKKNLLRPRFYLFLKEILRFNKNADRHLQEAKEDLKLNLGDLLSHERYSQDFQDWYLLPMGGCIWSCPTKEMLNFPAFTFLSFCKNHGLLQIADRPQWKTIVGGCNTYTNRVLSLLDGTFKNEEIVKVTPLGNSKGVRIETNQRAEDFDAVFFGPHPPQTLQLVKGINNKVDEVLSAFKYQKNTAYLHTDIKQLPDREQAWAAWNYRTISKADRSKAVSVSYLINKLQPLPKDVQMIVTLNPFDEISKDKIIKELNYEHPLFDQKAISAQREVPEIQGINQMYFSGAWMRYGFHEDGIWGAKQALKQFEKDFHQTSQTTSGLSDSATF